MSDSTPLRPLPASFYGRDAPDVAAALLGKVLGVGECVGRIVETEAYTAQDPASHSFRGHTTRNHAMYLPGGHLYVYLIYGVHHCANVVTGSAGDGQAVLIRAVHPIKGLDVMRRRRPGRSDATLCDGPGKLCAAFGIDRGMDGVSLGGPEVVIVDDGRPPPSRPRRTPRVGISVGRDTLWRFLDDRSP